MQVLSDLITALCHETALRPPAKMFSYLKQALLDEGKKNMAINLARKTDKPRGTPLVDGGHKWWGITYLESKIVAALNDDKLLISRLLAENLGVATDDEGATVEGSRRLRTEKGKWNGFREE
ncbi:hypothetical protein V6N11_075274 [Hibiscus sabdariffa]|uniref:Uncharacterized protein n=1 Tax=Hibiscus sabdariffa TaxID=183260 RepID=A0ABR2R6I6_9ROSI